MCLYEQVVTSVHWAGQIASKFSIIVELQHGRPLVSSFLPGRWADKKTLIRSTLVCACCRWHSHGQWD